MLTFIFCIYGTNLSFMYLIYLPFSDREFTAIPKACVESGQAYLNRIYISVKRSPLHMEESSSSHEMLLVHHLSCALCSRTSTECNRETLMWSRLLWDITQETYLQAMDCVDKVDEIGMSDWTPEVL